MNGCVWFIVLSHTHRRVNTLEYPSSWFTHIVSVDFCNDYLSDYLKGMVTHWNMEILMSYHTHWKELSIPHLLAHSLFMKVSGCKEHSSSTLFCPYNKQLLCVVYSKSIMMHLNGNCLLILVSMQVSVYHHSLWRPFSLIAGPYSVCYWSHHLFSTFFF